MLIGKLSMGIVGLAWLLTIGVVYQMLSGTFETRVCTTGCVQVIFGFAVASAVIGFVLSIFAIRSEPQLINKLCFLAAATLLIIFLTTAVIGTFF